MSDIKSRIRNIRIEVEHLISSYYRRETKQWYIDADTKEIPASNEHTREFQNKISSLNSQVRMLEEEDIVATYLDTYPQLPDVGDQIAKLLPLVSRRRHPELWPRINKQTLDGARFTFDSAPVVLGQDMFCGCTDEQLKEEANNQEGEFFQTKIEALRTQHTLRLQKIHNTGAECPNPKQETIYLQQNKHTVGNWNCKSCLNTPTEIVSASDADAALASSKALEWCPRFIPLLRKLPLPDYIKAAQGNNICYAGLVHSELAFTEEQEEYPSISPDQLAVEPTILITKKYILVRKKCDTCTYYDEEKKEYHEPEEVKANQVLQVMA